MNNEYAEFLERYVNARRESEKVEIIKLLSESDRRLKQKKQALEDMRNEYDLLEMQAYNTYKNRIMYSSFNVESTTIKAVKWLGMLKNGTDSEGNKLDKRKKYEEKTWYEYINEDISRLLGEDITIEEIINFNYGEGYEYFFKYNDKKYYIRIPVINNISLKSYQYDGEYAFTMSLHVCDSLDSYSSTTIGYTLFEEEMKDIWKKYQEKEE